MSVSFFRKTCYVQSVSIVKYFYCLCRLQYECNAVHLTLPSTNNSSLFLTSLSSQRMYIQNSCHITCHSVLCALSQIFECIVKDD